MSIYLSNNNAGRKLAAILFLFFSHNISAQTKITLEQAIDSTMVHNIEIRQARFDEAIAAEDLKAAKGATLPTLNGSVAAYRLFGRALDPTTYQYNNAAANIAQGSIYANVTLFQGFAKMNTIKQDKYLVDANKSNVAKIKNDLTLSVLYTYIQVLTNRDLLAASKQQLVIANDELARQQKFYKVGQKTLADLSQAKSQVANAEANQTNAQNELERSYLTLTHFMERDDKSPFLVVDPPKNAIDKLNTSYTNDEVYKTALETNPDIQVTVNKRIAAESGVDVAKGLRYPSLSFGGGLNTSYSSSQSTVVATQITGAVPIGVVQNTNAAVVAPVYQTRNVSFGDQITNNFNQAVGFTLAIPISNGNGANINVRKAKLNYQNSLATEQLAKNNMRKTVAEAVWDVHATQKKYASAQITFKSAADAFKVMQQRYSVGLANSLEINVSENERNIAEFSLIQTRYELILKSKIIDYYLGNKISF
ncbi:outer membrane protein [Mucilaginibacter gossypiicola]|uniref:Outer membrane protein n=1 Tax=Mucilaginibacter gossypiicola TaxID=551995 RepID=A0A1H8B437_9SPHI|nr:TolC family protein [Mucilaginibacter gossypiicola]SEM76864.1 outer membrane protein [Mucilaginibacter gossypiicola]